MRKILYFFESLIHKLFIANTPLQGGVAHIPHGLLTVFACYIHWSLGLIWFGTFMIYELNQEKHKKDEAHTDFFGYLIGVSLGTVGWFIYRYVIGG